MTTIDNPLDSRVQAIFLRGHLRLVSMGMTPPRGVRKGDLLKKAAEFTGQKYGRTEYAKAADDLTTFIRGNN